MPGQFASAFGERTSWESLAAASSAAVFSVEQPSAGRHHHGSALGLSQSLMAGVRFGRLEGKEVGQTENEIFAIVRNVHFIDANGASDLFWHPFYRDNPAVQAEQVPPAR